MARYTLDTTATEEMAITDARLKENAKRAAETPPRPPFDTNIEFLDATVRTLIIDVPKFIEQRLNALADRYRVATPDQRSQVDAILGV